MNKLYLRRDDCNCGPSPCWSSFSYRAATPPFPAVDRFGRAVGGSGSAWVLHGARFLAGFLVGCFARFFGRLTGSFVALSGSGPTVVSLLVRGTHRVFFVRTLSSRCPSALMLDAPRSTRSQTSSPSPPELGDCTGDTAAGEGLIVALSLDIAAPRVAPFAAVVGEVFLKHPKNFAGNDGQIQSNHHIQLAQACKVARA